MVSGGCLCRLPCPRVVPWPQKRTALFLSTDARGRIVSSGEFAGLSGGLVAGGEISNRRFESSRGYHFRKIATFYSALNSAFRLTRAAGSLLASSSLLRVENRSLPRWIQRRTSSVSYTHLRAHET